VTRYVAILAGGSGTRLWPLSRSRRPKQLLPLIGDRSLIQATVDRVAALVPHECILVITEASHADDLRAQLPELPTENIVVEPMRRGTAAAVGLAATVIARRDSAASMASLHSDHAVAAPDDFRRALAAGFEVAESDDWLVTLGIKPSSPHTGMGYIEVGPPIGDFGGRTAHRALRFVEKPDVDKARQFVAQGYLWNPGYFLWQVPVILDAFARLLPAMRGPLSEVGAALGTPGEPSVLRAAYERMPTETIDFGIMERADKVATIPSDFGWTDIGSWRELLEMAPKDADGNVIRGDHLGIDTRRTLVYGADRPVFTVGVEDLVIVDAGDALLICRPGQAERVKELVELLQADPSRAGLV
jgi:mannose-1-phosphate guanylyltransferase